MTMNVDEMRLKNTLSHEVHVTRHHKKDEDYALSVHAHRLCNLRVSVFVSLYLLLMWFVSCLSSVLVLLFMLYSYSFRSQFSVVGGILFTVLVGCCGLLRLFHDLFRNGPCDKSPENVTHHNSSHTTIGLAQSRDPPHPDSLQCSQGHLP